MPDNDKPTKSSSAPKIMDVINKHSQALATSRPVIVNKSPQADPMVVTKKNDAAKRKPPYSSGGDTPPAAKSDAEQSQAGLSIHHALRLEPVDPHKVGEVFTPSDTKDEPKASDAASAEPAQDQSAQKEPETAEPTTDDSPENPDSSQPEHADESRPANIEPPAAIESPAAPAKASESVEAETESPKPDMAKPDSADQSTDSVKDKGKDSSKPQDSIDERAEAEVLEPVDLLRDQVSRDHGSAVAILLGVLIIIILAAVAIDLAVDANLLNLSIPHTHFFSS